MPSEESLEDVKPWEVLQIEWGQALEWPAQGSAGVSIAGDI